jgi:hypothetical protein
VFKSLKSCAGVLAITAIVVGVPVAGSAGAAPGGNSANAKRCQHNGYQSWVRADQTPFVNVGDCVSYAAHGGTLTPRPPARTWDCSISPKPGLETVLLSGSGDLADPPTTADRYTYAALGTASFTGTVPNGPSSAGTLRWGLINAAGEFVLVNAPHAGYPFDFGGGLGEQDPPVPPGVLDVSSAVDGVTIDADLGFGTRWRWAIVENPTAFDPPPTDSVPVCTSAAFTVPNCPDTPNADGTCPYHAATPPPPLGPPAWTCSVTATPVPGVSIFGPITVVDVTATANGTLSGLPTVRLEEGGDARSANYALGAFAGSPIVGPLSASIGAGSRGDGVAPGTYTVAVYQDPWSFTPVCTNTVTVPPSP